MLQPVPPADGPTLPLLGSQLGAWFRSSGLPLGAIGEVPAPHPYIPTFSPSGIVAAVSGTGGRTSIGWRSARWTASRSMSAYSGDCDRLIWPMVIIQSG